MAKARSAKRRWLRWLFLCIAGVFLALFLLFWATGCGEESASGSGCVGTVTKTYTEYEPGVGITSGSVTIPTGSTRYYIAVERSDGTFCSKRLKKSEWLAGPQFSVGDLNVAGALYRALSLDLAKWPKLKAWLNRCWDRPAAKKVKAMREGK